MVSVSPDIKITNYKTGISDLSKIVTLLKQEIERNPRVFLKAKMIQTEIKILSFLDKHFRTRISVKPLLRKNLGCLEEHK